MPKVEFAVDATLGLTDANFAAVIEIWEDILFEFEDLIEFGDPDLGQVFGDGTDARAGAAAYAASTASLEVCNRSGDEVSVAYATSVGETNSSGEPLFRSQGWRNIPHGECSDLWYAPFANRYYYVFAQVDDGHYGGEYYFCTLDHVFDMVEPQCSEFYERRGFFQIDMDEGNRRTAGYVVNLNP